MKKERRIRKRETRVSFVFRRFMFYVSCFLMTVKFYKILQVCLGRNTTALIARITGVRVMPPLLVLLSIVTTASKLRGEIFCWPRYVVST